MAALDPRFPGALLWAAALAALIAVIGWETDWGRRVTLAPETPTAVAQPVAVALLPEYTLDGGAAARLETVERPAFVPTRRPAPPTPAQEPPKPRLQRGQFVLTGTALVDQQAMAFLREANSGKSRTVRKGDTINGMTVTEVAPDRVTLALGDETEGLALKVAAGPRTTIQPVQPPGAGVPARPGQPVAPGIAQPGVPQPGVPQPGLAQPAGMQAAQAGAPQPDPEAEAKSLLERRRAARAAQAAAEAAARGGAGAASGAPAGQAQAAPGAPDPGWAEVYRRMQQPRP